MLQLDAANVKSYPGTGTSWSDLSGTGTISTNYNSVLYNAAGYFNFDGTNQYSQGTNPNFSNTAITFTSWCRLKSNPTAYSQIIGSAGSSGAIYVIPNSSNVFGQFSFTTNGNIGSGSVNIPLDQVQNQLAKFKAKENIVVFCRSGNRSGQAKSILEQNGFSNVTNGGTWQDIELLLK